MRNPAYPEAFNDPLLWSDFYLTKYDDPDNTLALDFETYYDKETFSVSTLGAVAYANDERANFYLLAAEGRLDGKPVSWVGHPMDFPHWPRIVQGGVRLLAANAEFEETITWALAKHDLGFPRKSARNIEYLCVLDLARFSNLPGSLAHAIEHADLADKLPPIDKSIRAGMSGYSHNRGTPLPEGYAEYCLNDSRAALLLWEKYKDSWSDFERWFSVVNRRRNTRGVPIDTEKLDQFIQDLRRVIFDAEAAIPWDWQGAGLKTPLSDKLFRQHCRKHGLVPPASLAAKDEEYQGWYAEHGEKYPWIKARFDWRKANILLKKLSAMRSRLTPQDQMPFEQRYFGAHTGRAAGGAGRGGSEGGGGSGVNMQNLTKEPFYGVSERHVITAPRGHVLLVADYGQIEPRLLYLKAGMTKILQTIRSGVQIYEAHARLTMNYDDPRPLKVAMKDNAELTQLYALAKARVIGLGYGCGKLKFVTLASIYGLNITLEQSAQMVYDFRNTHPEITAYWANHEEWLVRSAQDKDPVHQVELLSGRCLTYFDPRFGQKPDGRWGTFVRNSPKDDPTSTWGGTLTENEIQATAGDVLRTGLSQLSPALLNCWIMDIHDEVVFCLPEASAEQMAADIVGTMTSIPWLPSDFPLEMSSELTPHYKK